MHLTNRFAMHSNTKDDISEKVQSFISIYIYHYELHYHMRMTNSL